VSTQTHPNPAPAQGAGAAASAADDTLVARPADAIEVGRIMGAWGIKGGLKLKAFAADPQALFSTKRWYIEPGEARGPLLLKPVSRPAPNTASAGLPLRPRLLKVVQAREQGDSVVATVQDIEDRDAAHALAGWRVFVPRTSFPTPAEGEFYWVDLIGLDVVNREGVPLGTVTGLLETGPHCVLQLQAPDGDTLADGGQRMIPFVDAYVLSVDLPGRRITVDWDASY